MLCYLCDVLCTSHWPGIVFSLWTILRIGHCPRCYWSLTWHAPFWIRTLPINQEESQAKTLSSWLIGTTEQTLEQSKSTSKLRIVLRPSDDIFIHFVEETLCPSNNQRLAVSRSRIHIDYVDAISGANNNSYTSNIYFFLSPKFYFDLLLYCWACINPLYAITLKSLPEIIGM